MKCLKTSSNVLVLDLKEIARIKKRNYISFFIIYFTLSIIQIYLAVYLPLYLLNIRLVVRSELAFIQVLAFSVLFLDPVLGFSFDKYVKNKKIIISFSILLFLISFFVSIFSSNYLPIFGIFLALNLLSQGIIKVGISKMIIDLSANEIIKDNNLVTINISSNIGSFIPSIVFLFVLSDLFDLNHWNMFFLIGVLSSLPMLLSIIFLKDFGNSLIKKKELQNEVMNSPKASPFNFIFLFSSYLLIWSDKLYQFPFSSWILTKFGQQSFNLYSISYIVFVLLNISGWIIGQKISKRENRKFKMFISEKKKTSALDSTLIQEKLMFSFKIKKRKKIIIITVGIYIFLTFIMAFSDFFLMMIVQGIIQVLAGIFLLNYISLMMTIVNNGKHKTFYFQCLKLSYAFSCVIFIPLGTYFSDFIPIETLILIAGMLSTLALAPLILLKDKPK
ncbi:MAG: hypothetical protein CEE42_09270 [Promethearchaeota archaeon Loki_b31]|nr:MAG: hypothetical protein CEE42_09270 [Candidatus Lokiarchaeota archaeon Loki_b31]